MTKCMIMVVGIGLTGSFPNLVYSIESEQPLLKAPWRGTAIITQGNYGTTSHFDQGIWDNIYAIDIDLDSDSDVLAPADGEIEYVDNDQGGLGGKELVIRHVGPTGKNFFTVYLHLSEIIVKSGSVKQGVVVAKSGSSGTNVTNPHLHFHLWSGVVETAYDSHTMPIERLLLRNVKTDSDFREYNARNGDIDDARVAAQNFESSQPAPAINSSIRLLQSPPYTIGQTITGIFSITNRGGSPISYDVLTIGGRLNVDTNVKDFPWHRNVTINPNDTYVYRDDYTLSEPGRYWFFPAYSIQLPHWRIADHAHEEIAADPGVKTQLDIAVDPAIGSGSGSDLGVGGGFPNDYEPLTPTTPPSSSVGSPFKPLEATIHSYSYDLLGRQNIAFVSGQYGNGNTDIYISCLDRGYSLQVTNDNVAEGAPAWSPDGTKLAFFSNIEGSNKIFIMDLATRDTTRLIDYPQSFNPSWSPDSKKIAFSAKADGKDRIFVIALGDSIPTQLLNGNDSGFWPVWSPVGNLIAYESQWKGDPFSNIWLINPDDRGKKELLTTYTERRQPAWSPDGSRIAYLNGTEVRIVNVDGTDDHLLGTGGPANNPAWSPDGSELAFSSFQNNHSGVFIIKTDGLEPERFIIPGALQSAWAPLLPVPSLSTTSIDFGNVENGFPKKQKLYIKNSSRTIQTTYKLSDNSDYFSFLPDIVQNLNAGDSTEVTVIFSPTSLGEKRGTLTISSDHSLVSPHAISLFGTGTDSAPAILSGLTATATNNKVSLKWEANKGPYLSHYTVYRSTTESTLEDSVGRVDKPDTSFTDTSLSAGTYYYRIMAVDRGGNKSGESNEVSVFISSTLERASSSRSVLVLTPDTLNFGQVRVGRLGAHKLIVGVQDSIGSDLTVDISSSDSIFSFGPKRVYLQPGRSDTLNIYFLPKEKDLSPRNSILNLAYRTSTGENAINTALTMVGQGVELNIVTSPSDTLDFGKVQIGDIDSLIVTLSNLGNGIYFKKYHVNFSESFYTSYSSSKEIKPGSIDSIAVHFFPHKPGNTIDSLVISGDDYSPLKVYLKGNGVSSIPGFTIGDFNGDNRVGWDDFFLFSDHFGYKTSDIDWNEKYDLDGDGRVDFSDFFLFAENFSRFQ